MQRLSRLANKVSPDQAERFKTASLRAPFSFVLVETQNFVAPSFVVILQHYIGGAGLNETAQML